MGVLILVIDGLGIGELSDAEEYKDTGSNTLGNLSKVVGGLKLPCLESMGLGNLGDFLGIRKNTSPISSFGVMEELSRGKDSITGHWEMMGIISKTPFPTYPDGFPKEIIEEFERRIDRKTLGNRAASGTEIIKELGIEHMKTGSPIVYTSADSVFQIAAHEDIIPPERLYEICKIAREILTPPNNVCRVIARPFIGPPFRRTTKRRDFPLPPPEETVLDMLSKESIPTTAIGKVGDFFSGRGFKNNIKAGDNPEALRRVSSLFPSEGLTFCTLTDFDTLYGHRNDPYGFADALKEFDRWLEGFLPSLKEDDYLFITADHGNDPTTPSTDHSREYVPVLFYNKALKPKDLGLRKGFCDIGSTVLEIFGLRAKIGRSFLTSP